MITDHNIAKEVLEKLEQSIQSINEAILIAKIKCAPGEYEIFKKEAGLLIGNIDVKLITPIHDKHPD